MSRDEEVPREGSDASSGRNPGGYGRPPAEHRFKKGQSGNPRGRPKKPKVPKTHSLEFSSQPANELLMQEAYRLVTIKDGDRPITVPLIQAVFRAMGVSAVKGNRFAQRNIADLVQNVESEDRKLRADYLQTMMEYKTTWEERIEGAKLRGVCPPEPLPHPDDIIIDLIEGRAFVCGPSTKEEKALWDEQIDKRKEAQKILTEAVAEHGTARNPDKRAALLEVQLLAQKRFDIINDNLPPRYRSHLKDRSWAEGASRPGSQKQQVWPGE